MIPGDHSSGPAELSPDCFDPEAPGSRGKETPSRILQLGGTAYSAALCCLVDTGFDLCNDHIREKYYLIDNQEVLGFQIKFRSLLKKKTT
uniref:Expressed protein n=1 Tax=Oryza sativa subsp. japonica TaxID=39947 RepID=H2KX09_ORYSJ|nr:expressed protein [Oryza sativa Japonica Group]